MAINTTGAGFFNVGYDFNAAPGSDGTITIDGGSYTNTYGDVGTNFYGSSNANITGTLTLTNSADLVLEPANPGNGLGFDVGFSGAAGYSAIGNLLIEGGSTLEARNTGYVSGSGTITGGYFNINIGRNADAKGYATVTGAGSRMTTEGGAARLTIGRNDGYGVLDIEQGGFVGAFNLTIGRDGGVGHINVDGVGSELKTSSAYGFYNTSVNGASTGYNSIGRGVGGKGYLSVDNGGVVNIENEDGISDRAFLRFARGTDSYGYGIVSGAGSELNIRQIGLSDQAAFSPYGASLIVGNSGLGKLVIEQAGSVEVLGHSAFVGVADKRGSEANTSEQSFIEVRSGGSLLIDGQGYEGGWLRVGNDPGDHGKLAISGTGSTVTVRNDLDDNLENLHLGAEVHIGHRGHGELYIDQGGKLIIDGADDAFPQLRIGRGSNGNEQGDVFATGLAIVTGSGSSIDLYSNNTVNSPAFLNGLIGGGSVIIGNRNGAEGELQILDGGRVSNTGPNTRFAISDDRGSQGTVIVDGAGSLLEAGERLTIGMAGNTDGSSNGTAEPVDGGVGELRITNGGTVETDAMFVGERSVLDIDGGTLNIADELTLWGRFEIGRDTVGTATLTNVNLSFEIGSVWVFDVDGFGAGQADLVTFTGDGDDINTRGVPIVVDLDENLSVAAGDQVALVEWTGTLTNVVDRVVYDQNRGLEFLLEQQGNQLVLVAQESTSVNLVGDGGPNTLTGTSGDDTLSGLGGNDTLIGLAGDDDLFGGADDDILNGGEGADNLQGGGGDNTASYEDATARVVVNLLTPANNTGEAAGDTFSSIQNIIGSDFNDALLGSFAANKLFGGGDDDFLFGSLGNDMLFGQAGDDELDGGAGADVLNGGSGTNSASYENSTGLTADLFLTANNTGDAAGDTYIQIQDLIGTAFGDVLWGNFGDNQLDGKAGNDFLHGRAGNDTLQGGDGDDRLDGGAGADVLDGDLGVNTVDYLSSGIGITIDLTNPGNNTGDAAGDTYFTIQNVIGSFQSDIITGDGGDNQIIASTGNDVVNGMAGNDTLFGQGGDDILDGGAGADLLAGGVGNDTASYASAMAGLTADLFVSASNTGDAAGDVYSAIRNLTGSGHNDVLRGTFSVNRIEGGDGNDVMQGRGGSDTYNGGAGSDTFIFQNGFGIETIEDFDEFNASEKISLASVTGITDFADLTANHLNQNGANAEITDGAGTIIIANALIGDLGMDDFLF